MKWWCELPAAWQPLDALIQLLDALFIQLPQTPLHSRTGPRLVRRIPVNSYSTAQNSPGHHVLTYAETGFAPLNIHTRHLAIRPEQLAAFADEVNERRETGTLHPLAPVSAVPREVIRGYPSIPLLAEHIVQFLVANVSGIGATTLVCDFGTPRLGPHVLPALESALEHEAAQRLAKVLVLVRS